MRSITTSDLEVGHNLPAWSKLMTQEWMTKYNDLRLSSRVGKRVSAGKNIHTDAEVARSQGLPGPVADGMMSTAMLSAMLVDVFGEGFLRGGSLATRYIKMTFAGDKLTLRAFVREKLSEGARARLYLDVWCENQNGEKLTVGTASALV